MSRKRALKKLQKRQESARTRLEELYLRGADDDFLALADEQIKDPATSLLAAEWAEVAGRALRQSLGRADLGRLERLLPSLRRGGLLLPGIALAETVLDLAAGRLEAARSRLAALDPDEEETAVVPRDLVAALRSLAEDRPGEHWPLDDPLDDPYLVAAERFFRALQSLEAQAFAPSGADREELARSLEALRAAAPAASASSPETGALHRLLESAGRSLSLLSDLAALEDKLSRPARPAEDEPSSASSRVIHWLRGPGPLLAATLTASGPPLLAPLQHTVHLRWRAVLERVAAREGSPGLAALCAADPRLLAVDVRLPGGIQGGLASLRQGAQVRQLLAGRHFRELAGLLRSRSQTEPDSGALAALWSLELWVLQLWDAEDDRERMWLRELVEPTMSPLREALVRLQAMAGEIGRRFPAEQRIEVARRLRSELFDLCEHAALCEPIDRAALSLLEHLPGDIGLLIAGIAGAVADGDGKTLRALQGRLPPGAAQGTLTDNLAVARRLMTQVAREAPSTIARSLDLLRPLFAEGAWREIATLVAWEMSRVFGEVLSSALFETAVEGARAGDRTFADIRRQLDRLRPILAGAPGLAAMELAFDYCRPGPIAEKRLKKFLAEDPGLDSALSAFLILQSAAFALHVPERLKRARNNLARAVIERLDGRWELWEPAFEGLFMFAGEAHMPRLGEKIRQILASPEISSAGRQRLERALQSVERFLKPPPPRTIRKPRRRRSGTPQLRLEMG